MTIVYTIQHTVWAQVNIVKYTLYKGGLLTIVYTIQGGILTKIYTLYKGVVLLQHNLLQVQYNWPETQVTSDYSTTSPGHLQNV